MTLNDSLAVSQLYLIQVLPVLPSNMDKGFRKAGAINHICKQCTGAMHGRQPHQCRAALTLALTGSLAASLLCLAEVLPVENANLGT